MTHAADGHDLIRVKGARVNNLHGVVAAAPGLRTVLEIAPPRLCR